jgi:peptidoglycan hydrolase CwlO-like protein
MSKTSNEKIKQLQREIESLQKVIFDTQEEVGRNQHSINEMYRAVDLLQSFIPSRDKWRDVFLSFAN